jgi:hypothetical protein
MPRRPLSSPLASFLVRLWRTSRRAPLGAHVRRPQTPHLGRSAYLREIGKASYPQAISSVMGLPSELPTPAPRYAC